MMSPWLSSEVIYDLKEIGDVVPDCPYCGGPVLPPVTTHDGKLWCLECYYLYADGEAKKEQAETER